MAKPSDELPEAPQHHHKDDRQTVVPEPSIETIIKRIRARSERSSAELTKPKSPLPSPAPRICKPLVNGHFYRPKRSVRAFATQFCYTTVMDDWGPSL